MFGDYSESQVTLNLPMEKIRTNIAIYTTLFISFSKYEVIVTPVATAVEDTLLSHNKRLVSIFIRTIIVICTLLVALYVPFFGYVMCVFGLEFTNRGLLQLDSVKLILIKSELVVM